MAELSPEAARLLEARKAAVEELKVLDQVDRAITDPAVVRLSNARLFESNITLRTIAGEPVTAAEIRAANDMVVAARDAVKVAAPMTVTVEFVKSTDATPDGSGIDGLKACRRCGWAPPEGDYVRRCYRCGLRPGDDTLKPWQPINITGEPSPEQASKATPDVRAPAAEPAANVVPRRDSTRPGIHDAVLLDDAPAHMLPKDKSWRAHVASVGGYDVFQPAPDCGAAHVLPTPPPECFGK